MTDLQWLYNLIEALDELANAAERLTDPDPDDAPHNEILNDLQDAVSNANAAYADVPVIRDWIKSEGVRALSVLTDEVLQLADLAMMVDPTLTRELMTAVYAVISESGKTLGEDVMSTAKRLEQLARKEMVTDKFLPIWRDQLVHALAIMDEKGRTLEGGHVSLFSDWWEELRKTLLTVTDSIQEAS